LFGAIEENFSVDTPSPCRDFKPEAPGFETCSAYGSTNCGEFIDQISLSSKDLPQEINYTFRMRLEIYLLPVSVNVHGASWQVYLGSSALYCVINGSKHFLESRPLCLHS
jgi:hypothetical protein